MGGKEEGVQGDSRGRGHLLGQCAVCFKYGGRGVEKQNRDLRMCQGH